MRVFKLLLLAVCCCSAHQSVDVEGSVSDRSFVDDRSLWVDTDLAIHTNGMFDPDDLIALKFLYSIRPKSLLGVSVSSANSTIQKTKLDAKKYLSWAHVIHSRSPCDGTGASPQEAAIDSVVILALGPATNLPELVSCFRKLELPIDEVIFVGGREADEEFWLKQPLPVIRPMRDLNYETDKPAFRALHDSGVKITLIPFRAGNAVRLNLASIANVVDDKGYEAVRNWIATLALIGGDWTMPAFDPAAVAYLIWPEAYECFRVDVVQIAKQLVVEQSSDPNQKVKLCGPRDGGRVAEMITKALKTRN